MTRPIIAVTDSPFPSLDPVKTALAKLDPDLRMAKSGSAEDIIAVANDADAVIVCYAQITAAVIAGLNRCKVIGRTGLGVDNIDVPAAAARGIAVTYVPDYCLREVSDHTMALLLALARKVPLANKLVHSGRWELPPLVPFRRLEGQVLGLVGFGNIPRAVVPKAKAFGLTVITHDPFVSKDVLASAGVEGVSFDDLLARSDFVICLAVATDETENLFDAPRFARVKRGASFINASRGNLVDEAALADALASGRLAGAALDVGRAPDQRPSPWLAARPAVIATPHIAGNTPEAVAHQAWDVVRQVTALARGDVPEGAVNAESWMRRAVFAPKRR